MAYGFGATLGTGITDRITTATLTLPTIHTLVLRAYRNGVGGSGSARIFEGSDTVAHTFSVNRGVAAAKIALREPWSTTDGNWNWVDVATGAWRHYAITYDGSATTNDPTFYLDAADQNGSITETATPVGSFDSLGEVFYIGNTFGVGESYWDGMIAEVGLYNRILSLGEIEAQAEGLSPLAIPQGLVYFRALIRSLHGDTLTGTPLVQPHPRIRTCAAPIYNAAAELDSPLVTVFAGSVGERTT